MNTITKAGWSLGYQLRTTDTRSLELLSLLHRHGKTFHRLQEEVCSYEWADTDWHRKRCNQIEARMEALGAEFCEHNPGYQFTLSGDPRGFCSYLLPPDDRGDDWGGRGYGLSA